MTKSAVIIGYSGHSYVVLDALLSNEIVVKGYFEKSEKHHDPFGLKYLGNETEEESLKLLKDHLVFIGIGDNLIRSKIFNKLSEGSITISNIAHKSAIISSRATIGEGTVIMAGSVINSMASIGKAVICNSAAVIEHECVIADFCHIAPGAVLAGNVTIGTQSFIGANSVVKQGINIGSNVIIGAGSVITKNIPDNSIAYGNPAKIKV